MAIEFRITRGARAGARERSDKSVITIGRHPMNDLRFDLERDLDVSARHAELRIVGERITLRDLGSTNGTFVNGERVAGERDLAEGDAIRFGADGPQVTIHRVAEPTRPPAPPGAATGSPAAPVPPPRGPEAAAAAAPRPAAPPRRPTEVRIAEAVEAQTGSLRRMVLALGALVLVGGAGAFWVAQRSAAETQRQIAVLLAANDSLARTLEQRVAQTGLADSALAAARTERERLAAALRERQASGGDLTALSAEMRTAQARTAILARIDYAAITAANRPAIVFIAVEMPDGALSSGTGFNLLPSGLVVTNRHVVQGPDGARARRVAVVFEGTRGAWIPATIERVSATDELAFLRLGAPGPHPAVSGVARDGVASALGDPVAILGYPLGTATAGMDGDIDRLRPTATLGFGTVSKVLDETLQLDAFAARGSSGSPVLDARGLVVGVVYGGAAESGGRIVYAVPGARLAAQLPEDAAGIIR